MGPKSVALLLSLLLANLDHTRLNFQPLELTPRLLSIHFLVYLELKLFYQ